MGRIERSLGVLGLALLAVAASGCGQLTIRTWVTVIEEDSSGMLTIGGATQGPPISRLQGGFLSAIQVNTNDLDGIMNGTLVMEDVRLAGFIEGGIGRLCNWNDPAGSSGGTFAIDLLGGPNSSSEVFLDAKATTELSELIGLGPIDFEEYVDFDLASAMDIDAFLAALASGDAEGLFTTTNSIASTSTFLGSPATFSLDIAVTNTSLPPLFDDDMLQFCGPHFDEQGSEIYYGINAKSSYLARNGNDAAADPLVIALDELGVVSGDSLHLTVVGGYNLVPALRDGVTTKLGGVFSATNAVAGGGVHRVVDAIDAGPNLATWPTQICGWLGCIAIPWGNDIPEDFPVNPARDIVVPQGARYLILAPVDDWRVWGDNSGLSFGVDIGVTPAS